MPNVGASTKGALLAMIRTLAVEEGGRGIRVNAINPGIIVTRMAEEAVDGAFAARLADHTPLGRNGRPEDIAGAVGFLLSEDAAFVTGQEITVGGGFTLGGIRLRGADDPASGSIRHRLLPRPPCLVRGRALLSARWFSPRRAGG